MAFESVSLRAEKLRFGGTRRVGRNSSGFGLIDTLLALLISATLIAPVLGGVLIVLKTAPGAADDSVISGQQATNRQNFELNLTSARMRNEWSDATIVKSPGQFDEYLGLDCGGGGLGSLSGNSTTKLLFSLQVRSGADLDLNSLRGTKLINQGFTRIVYSLLPDGNGLYSLVRRECAVEANGQPRVRSVSNPEGWNEDGKMTSDYRGWRLQPGRIKGAGAGLGYASTANWAPETPKKVLSSVSAVTVNSARCNDRWAPDPSSPAYTRCDLNFTVTFGDGRTHTVRLYQGFGF
jgi:hypothetical protein